MASTPPQPTSNGSTSNGRSQSLQSPRLFKALASGIQGLVRSQHLSEEHLHLNYDANANQLVQRIAVTLSSPSTYKAASTAVFQRYAIQVNKAGGPPETELPTSRLPDILTHWSIPTDHLPLFWALLRKEAKCWGCAVLPPTISFGDFQVVLVKVLRRLRDRYCGSNIQKRQFVTQNTKGLEEDYIRNDSCGKGSFGECFFVTHRVTKKQRVAKTILKSDAKVPSEEIAMELNTLKRLDHPHVVRLFEWFETSENFLFVMQAAVGGDLKSMLKGARDEGNPGLSESTVHAIMDQGFKALVYIHSQRVIHRDLKPANMLVAQAVVQNSTAHPHILLADFGVSELFEASTLVAAQTKGTLAYMGPEVFMEEVSPKSDVWSMGVVMYELLCGTRPFRGDNPMALYAAIKLKKGQADMALVKDAGGSQEACDFIKKLLNQDEGLRPTSHEASEELWLRAGQNGALQDLPRRQTKRITNSMVNFGQKSAFSKALLNCVAGQLDTSSLEKLNCTFEALDTDKNGRLSVQELKQGLTTLGLSEDAIESLADSMDVDNNGEVEYSEFVAGCLDAQSQLVDGVLFHAFGIFDVDNDGKISLDELRVMLCGGGPLNAVLPDGKTVEDVLKEVDTSKDGAISYTEFKAYLEKESAGQVRNRDGETISPKSIMSSFAELPVPEPMENVSSVLRTLAEPLARKESELETYASLLTEKHWLSTVDDLRSLCPEDWPRLNLPLKLERALRTYIRQGS